MDDHAPSIELPCPRCGRRHRVDQEVLRSEGGSLRCRWCKDLISLATTAAILRRAEEASAPARPDRALRETGGDVRCPKCGYRFAPDPGDTRPVVLVIEDSEFFLNVAREALGSGYRIVEARTAEEGLAILESTRVDLVLLDIHLPGESGVAVLERRAKPGPPVLIYTGMLQNDTEGRGWTRLRELGADDIVAKAMNMEAELREKVDGLVRRKPETSESRAAGSG